MKLFYGLLFTICSVFIGTSCNDFLKLSSQDLIIPKTVEHYKELLQGEGYFKKLFEKGYFVALMTDDIEYFAPAIEGLNATSSYIDYCENVFKWDKEIEETLGDEGLYKCLYKQILTANTCLTNLDDMEGTQAEKDCLKGQACFVRAYGYFILANLYAQSYNEAGKEEICIPLVLDPTPSLIRYPQSTIEEAWALIKKDIDTAIVCLGRIEPIENVYEINQDAALVLASRIALFMENFEETIKWGEKLLTTSDVLMDITDKTEEPAGRGESNFFDPTVNKEIVFMFDPFSSMRWGSILDNSNITIEFFRVSQSSASSLMALYDFDEETKTGDRRKIFWFEQPDLSYAGTSLEIFNKDRYSPFKFDRYDNNGEGAMQAFRNGEVYLNLAEAYARKAVPDVQKALDYLNALRAKRIAPYTELTSGDFASTEKLVEFIWEERRRELCFEEFHRWWDLRRTGQPAVEHRWRNEIYVLEEHDPAYLLNYPVYERDFNPALMGNPRPVRVSVQQ